MEEGYGAFAFFFSIRGGATRGRGIGGGGGDGGIGGGGCHHVVSVSFLSVDCHCYSMRLFKYMVLFF